MKSGYVYVISTDLYAERDIYKIGFTDNLVRRLKDFNNTRTYDDQYYLVNYWKSVKYKTLETRIHQALINYRHKNELYICPLDIINKTMKSILDKDSFFSHYDLVIIGADYKKVQWHKQDKYFSVEQDGLRVMMNEDNMKQELRNWISINDKYNLYQFICSSHFDELIYFLKQQYIYEETISDKIQHLNISDDVSHYMKKISL
jgi:hypothetical protein